MSLELLKERFRSEYFPNQIDGTGLTHLESVRFQYEKLLEEKQKVIEKTAVSNCCVLSNSCKRLFFSFFKVNI